MREQFEILRRNLANLGARRLITLSAAFLLTMSAIGILAIYLNVPAFETLYVGLDRDDINRMGVVLDEEGFKFDVDKSGTTLLVAAGTASQARMVLAEKGLPASSGAGYELFDNLGSLGLTSFMQEMTKVRALEGEVSRSIQSINGVKAARVHIVMPERAAFRDRDRKPTASILIKAESEQILDKAQAIRHLVAAAVPGLASDDVTVMDATGRLLASGQDQYSNSLTGSFEIQRQIESDIEEKIGQALAPQLGAFNYRVGVQAQIDTDHSSSQETIFDPASRVERSVQVVRSEDSSTQKSESQNTSVEKNMPQEKPAATISGPISAETREKREETTNYEINSKKVETQRNGYRVQRLSVSVIINRTKIAELMGGNPQASDIDARVAEIQKIAATAAGFDEVRGDKLHVSAIDFVEDAVLSAPNEGIVENISANIGTIINSLAFIIAVLLILFLGIRPLISAVSPQGQLALENLEGEMNVALLAGKDTQSDSSDLLARTEFSKELESIKPEILTKTRILPAERLRAMVDLDVERTAQVLRKWLLEDAA